MTSFLYPLYVHMLLKKFLLPLQTFLCYCHLLFVSWIRWLYVQRDRWCLIVLQPAHLVVRESFGAGSLLCPLAAVAGVVLPTHSLDRRQFFFFPTVVLGPEPAAELEPRGWRPGQPRAHRAGKTRAHHAMQLLILACHGDRTHKESSEVLLCAATNVNNINLAALHCTWPPARATMTLSTWCSTSRPAWTRTTVGGSTASD
jgi:hypothetical protein